MFVRNVLNQDMMIGGRQYRERVGHANTYETAFPFDRCAPGGTPGAVATVAIHGVAPTVTTATDLWAQNIVRTLPTAGFTIGVSSSSADDVLTSGTGAWSVEVDLLDTNYVPHTITMNLNGQTKVSDTAYVATALRINDIRVTGWGTGLANAGEVYVYDASDTVTAGVPQTSTKIFHKVLATANVARGAFYTVPAGCQLQTQQVRGGIVDSSTTNRAATLDVVAIRLVGGKRVKSTFPISGQIGATSGMVSVIPDFPLSFDEKTDVTIQGTASGAVVLAVYMDAVLYYK
jgi:hypothetical protein